MNIIFVMRPTNFVILFWTIFLLELAFALNSTKVIKCYVCNSGDSKDCNNIESGQRTYLKQCTVDKCFVKEEEDPFILGNYIRTRGCIEKENLTIIAIELPLYCECSADGCNYNNLCIVKSGSFSKAINASTVIVCLLLAWCLHKTI